MGVVWRGLNWFPSFSTLKKKFSSILFVWLQTEAFARSTSKDTWPTSSPYRQKPNKQTKTTTTTTLLCLQIDRLRNCFTISTPMKRGREMGGGGMNEWMNDFTRDREGRCVHPCQTSVIVIIRLFFVTLGHHIADPVTSCSPSIWAYFRLKPSHSHIFLHIFTQHLSLCGTGLWCHIG